ncbi:hypothetical protein PRIC1_007002 [Phytophthora ramorum]
MSSPLEPREGVDVLSNPRSTRPFTAPDARGGDLLTVLVHFGQHLDTLLPRETQPALDSAGVSTATGERLNTYVVASVGTFAASPCIVRCCRGSSVNAEDLPASTPSYPEGRVLYEQKCSPYAATRVVEGSTSPSWNELLAVPLPSEWPHTLSRGQHPPDQRPAALDSTHLALKLELVERGASHQEDFLLASCVLPLAKIACQLQQRRFALAFPTGGTPEQVPPACIYVSLQASSRSQVSNANALDQVEVTVESFTPVVATGSEDEGMPVDGTSLTALINLRVGAVPELVENLGVLEEHFTRLRDGEVIAEPSPLVAMPTNSKRAGQHAGLTPSSSSATGSASGVYEWLFPFSFALPTNNQVSPFVAVDIVLFETSSVPNKLVGCGHLELSPATGQAVKRDGWPRRHTVIPVTLVGGSARVFGHIALRLRWWDAAAWSAFVADIPARRVVCTNRWKRSPRLTLAWMGALLRGLNRHPVTSICDAGGVSGVLAELLAEPSSTGENKQSPQHEQPQQHQQSVSQLNFIESTETGALLREQLAHLQAEGTAQRVQIERLQNDLDTRLAAIQTCGLEIVALRREARQKDEQLQKLKEQVDAAQRREQQQLAELLVSTTSNGMAFPTRPEQQAASQRFTLLASKYKELDQEYKGMKQQLVDAQRTVASYASLETRHAKLQEAHLVQGALVQRLQRDKQHAAALKKAVRMQEKVIRQFEQTVAQQSAEVPERPSPRQLAPGTEQLDADSGDSETREALLRIRVRVLEQQLQTNARTAATEMSALRMRILELESRRSGK